MRINVQGYKGLQIPSFHCYNFEASLSLVTLHHIGKYSENIYPVVSSD